MNKIELMNMLKRDAEKLRSDTDYFTRNAHMHTLKDRPSQEVIDNVLCAFLNTVGMNQGIDYGMYSTDFKAL